MPVPSRRNDERVWSVSFWSPSLPGSAARRTVERRRSPPLELKHSADVAGGEIHHRHAALPLVASRRQWHAVHRRRLYRNSTEAGGAAGTGCTLHIGLSLPAVVVEDRSGPAREADQRIAT